MKTQKKEEQKKSPLQGGDHRAEKTYEKQEKIYKDDHMKEPELTQETIQRCPHDKENPYTMINRDLIRDESISPNCRWLLVYLLSNKEGWKISVQQICNHAKGFLGRDKVRLLINEAIEAGYMRKEANKEKNLHRGFQYFISETPKFKKYFRETEFQAPEIQGPENTSYKDKQDSKNTINLNTYKKEYIKEKPANASPSANAAGLASYFFKSIQKMRKDLGQVEMKERDLKKWAKDIDLMLEKDSISPERIKALIDWLPTSDFWRHNVLCPSKLREKLEALEVAIGSSVVTAIKKANAQTVYDLKKEYPKETVDLKIKGDYAVNQSKGKELSLSMNPEAFKKALAHLCGGIYK